MSEVMARAEWLTNAEAAAMTGMTTAMWAHLQPDKPAVIDPDGTVVSFAEVNARANQIVRLLRNAGLKAGDAVALVMPNRHEFVEVQAATRRGGFRLTPVNWHLAADEIAYILNDCEAKAVFGEARVATVRPGGPRRRRTCA
jgi:long-chain acyl-CoA synthetase